MVNLYLKSPQNTKKTLATIIGQPFSKINTQEHYKLFIKKKIHKFETKNVFHGFLTAGCFADNNYIIFGNH